MGYKVLKRNALKRMLSAFYYLKLDTPDLIGCILQGR